MTVAAAAAAVAAILAPVGREVRREAVCLEGKCRELGRESPTRWALVPEPPSAVTEPVVAAAAAAASAATAAESAVEAVAARVRGSRPAAAPTAA
jgi:hypothetical protein